LIEIKCTGSDELSLGEIKEFQGNLKYRTEKDVDKIILSIRKYGFSFPFFIWKKGKVNYCLDGHGRIKALERLLAGGEEIPKLPVVYIQAKSEAEAKNKLLRVNSQYGVMTVESVLEFMGEIEFDTNEISLPKVRFNNDKESEEIEYKQKYEIVIPCENENNQKQIYEDLIERGVKCRLSTL